MQCDDCKKVYVADNENQPCPKCGGKGTVLVDISDVLYGNRAERRKAKKAGLPFEKYLPCPECKKATVRGFRFTKA